MTAWMLPRSRSVSVTLLPAGADRAGAVTSSITARIIWVMTSQVAEATSWARRRTEAPSHDRHGHARGLDTRETDTRGIERSAIVRQWATESRPMTALMAELALECGCPLSSLKERVYASGVGQPDRFAILIYTSTPAAKASWWTE
jgi:hypothetical protein